MSSGHDTSLLGPVFVDEHLWVYTDERVLEEFNKAYMLFRNYDVAYLAGYSKNGRSFYIDRHLPLHLRAGTRSFTTALVINHERMEAAIIHGLGWGYAQAHTMAENYEDQIYKNLGYDPQKVEAAYQPYIKAAAHEKIKLVPKDLDLTPYIDSHDTKLLKAIQRAQ